MSSRERALKARPGTWPPVAGKREPLSGPGENQEGQYSNLRDAMEMSRPVEAGRG